MPPKPKPEPVLSISRFFTGMVTQRSPLNTPFAYAGLNVIQRNDALIGGLNCELSNNFTLQRRPGFPRYCSSVFGVNEFPLSYFSARVNGQVVDLVDTNLAVYTFTSSSKNLLFTKSAGAGQTFFQQIGNIIYFANGVDNKKWVPAQAWAASKVFAIGTMIVDPNGNIQQVTSSFIPGTSGFSQPTWSTTAITGTTGDGNLQWTCRGSQVSNWGTNAPVSAPTLTPTLAANSSTRFWWPAITLPGTYSIIDGNGNVQNSNAAGTTGGTVPNWSTVGQTLTQDNTLPWIESAGPINWTPNTVYFATVNGSVIDSNNNLQVVQFGGTSGASAPTWNTTFNATTTDGTITWLNVGSAKFLAFRGYQWAYAYHTCYGHVSTASPVTISTGPIIGSSFSVPISGTGSADTQCDFIWVFRIRDGGSVFEFAGQVPNPGAVAWNFTDTLKDDDLNDQLIAARGHLNDPPPAGLTVLAWHMKRMWGGAGNTMQFGIGPDRVIGVAEECWPPANLETFSSNVQKLASTTQGLCILTNDQWWVEMGGPQTLSFFPQKILDNFGISSPNCLVQDGDQIFMYTTAKQLWSLSLGNGKEEDGFAVGDILAASFNPTSTYLAIHRNGTDVGVFLSDGTQNVLRYSLNLNCWGTAYQPVGGVGAIGSIETGFGTYSLLAGRPTGAGAIMARSLTTFQDDVSSTYTWNAQIGSIHFSSPGTPPEELDSIVVQMTNAGTQVSVGVRINEIDGTFINIPIGPDDPFDLPSQTMRAKRYDLRDNQQGQPIQIRHMQVQLSGVAENAKSEILGIHFCPQAA